MAVIESTADGILVVDRDGKISGSNKKFQEIWRIPDEVIAKGDDDKAIEYVLDQLKDTEAFLSRVRELYAKPEDESFDTLEFKDGRVIERYSKPQKIKDEVVGRVWGFHDVTERKKAEEDIRERMWHAEFVAEIGMALTESGSMQEAMGKCCQSMVNNLEAAFARIWTFNETENMLELQASAGMYTHIDGGHSRVPVGKFKIGLIAQERKPHLTNHVVGDPHVGEQEWAKREGMVAFAGYPLVIDDKLIGVVAMFARKQLSEMTLRILETAAYEIALGIEHRIAVEVIKESRAMAESATKLKDKFVELVAHDLRSPFASMLGLLKLLVERIPRFEDAENQNILDQIFKSGDRMIATIDDLLKVSRFQTGHIVLHHRFFKGHTAVSGAIGAFSHNTAHKGVEIINEVPPDMRLYADQTLFDEVLLNLLSNAVKFCSRGDTITFFVPPGLKSAIAVRDTGKGISENVIPNIFKHEVTTTTPGTAGELGTGLGLPFSQDIMKAHGGELAVESATGKGSVFTAILPYVKPAALVVDDDSEMRLVVKMHH